jgi:hypothetical protein
MTSQRRSSLFTKFIGTMKNGLSRRSSNVAASAGVIGGYANKAQDHQGEEQELSESTVEPRGPLRSDDNRTRRDATRVGTTNVKRQHLLSFRKSGYERDFLPVAKDRQTDDRLQEAVDESKPEEDSIDGRDADAVYQELNEKLQFDVASGGPAFIGRRLIVFSPRLITRCNVSVQSRLETLKNNDMLRRLRCLPPIITLPIYEIFLRTFICRSVLSAFS